MNNSNRPLKWQWGIVIALVLLAIAFPAGWYWENSADQRLLARAGEIRLGQTEADVFDAMKNAWVVIENRVPDNPSTASMPAMKNRTLHFRAPPGIGRLIRHVLRSPPPADPRPSIVEVKLDDDGKVRWIRRGEEVVEGKE